MTSSEWNSFAALIISLVTVVVLVAIDNPGLSLTLSVPLWITLKMFFEKLDQHYIAKRQLAKSAN